MPRNLKKVAILFLVFLMLEFSFLIPEFMCQSAINEPMTWSLCRVGLLLLMLAGISIRNRLILYIIRTVILFELIIYGVGSVMAAILLFIQSGSNLLLISGGLLLLLQGYAIRLLFSREVVGYFGQKGVKEGVSL